MLAIKIDKPDIERRLKEYAKEHKKPIDDLINDAIQLFLDSKKDKLKYPKKDPLNHLQKIEYDYNEELCDDTALTHIQNSAEFVHNLRRKKV